MPDCGADGVRGLGSGIRARAASHTFGRAPTGTFCSVTVSLLCADAKLCALAYMSESPKHTAWRTQLGVYQLTHILYLMQNSLTAKCWGVRAAESSIVQPTSRREVLALAPLMVAVAALRPVSAEDAVDDGSGNTCTSV